MKKSLLIIGVICFIVFAILFLNLRDLQKRNAEAAKFNASYEAYNQENLNGLDITTVINKAINNNNKYNIQKGKDGLYLADEEHSIQIYVTMMINQKTYPMEKINALGINSFIEYFGAIHFKCTNITYHKKTGKIASMTFEATEY